MADEKEVPEGQPVELTDQQTENVAGGLDLSIGAIYDAATWVYQEAKEVKNKIEGK